MDKGIFLLHGYPTYSESGPWAWCLTSLYHLRSDWTSQSVRFKLKVHHDGSAMGGWYCTALTSQDVKSFRPYSSFLSVKLRIMNAMRWPKRCLLLRPSDISPEENLYLLVWTLLDLDPNAEHSVISCLHIGVVVGTFYPESVQTWRWVNIKLGADRERDWSSMEKSRQFKPMIIVQDAQERVFQYLRHKVDEAWDKTRLRRTQQPQLLWRLFWRSYYWCYDQGFKPSEDESNDDIDLENFDLFASDEGLSTYRQLEIMVQVTHIPLK